MGSLRCRLPARIVLSALLAALALAMAAVTADAAGSGLTLAVHVGYQDVVKPGEWTPVTVDARNTGADVDVVLEIQEALNAQPGVSGLTIYQQPISLPDGASKRVRTYLVEDTTGATVTARIIHNGRVAISQASVTSSTTSTLVGVLSDQSSALDDFAAVHPGGLAARVVHLHPDDIADSAIALRAFDIVVIDDFATDSLTARQRMAVADFVQDGGNLLLGTGASWHKTLAGLPAAILPMEPRATLNVHQARAVGGHNIEVAFADAVNGRAWLSEGGVPLIVDRGVGAGIVTMATFDWNQDPIAAWSGTKDLLRQVLARAVFGGGGSGTNYPNGMGGPFPAFGGSMPSVASKSNALAPVLGNLPGLDLPSLQLTAGLVLLYVLLVGPVNYLVLGAMRRRPLALGTETMTAAPQLTGRVQLLNGKLVGTIENHSDLTFTDAVLIAGDNFQTFGALKPGATAAVSLVPKPTNPAGQPLYTRVYPNASQSYGPGADQFSGRDRENLAKTQILSVLPVGGNFKGGISLASPLLVAWTHASFQDVTVNGSHPRSTAQSAVVLSLAVDQLGAGPLPAGLLSGRIVDVVGDAQAQAPPGMLQLQSGSVTYEFTPALAGGAHLTGLSVNVQNPYGAKIGPPGTSTQTGPAVLGQVWNWSGSTWTDIAYQDNGITALPDSAINPATGLVRLRLSTTTGGLLGGSLTLSGTIK